MRKLFIVLILTVLSLPFSALCQTDSAKAPAVDGAVSVNKEEKEERDKRIVSILDQIVGDGVNLRLAQNRAIVFALAGDLFWQFDEKRSAELFRNAGAELLAVNADNERERAESDDPYSGMFDWEDIRQEVLPLIAKRDPDLALELLVQSRPQRVTDAMARMASGSREEQGYTPERMRAQREIALEQRFALQVAQNDPDKAIKLIKDSLSRGISYNVMEMLQQLNQKSEKKASELATDVIRKIVETDLAKKADDRMAALQFFQFATNRPPDIKQKIFQFSESQVADLANKLAATFLAPAPSTEMTMGLSRALPSFEKVLPERVPALRQRLNDSTSKLPPEMRRRQQQQKLWDASSTPEEIIGMIPKLNELERTSAYESLIHKIRGIDDDVRAKKLIDQIPDPKTRERAIEQFESNRISRQAREGKLDEARRSIANLTKKRTQVQQLVALALEFHKKATEESKETAAVLLRDAKALTNEIAEDEDDLANLMDLIRGYSVVDPAEAFRLFGPVVDQINDVVQATAVLSRYNKRNRSFRRGEMVMRVGSWSSDGVFFFRYVPQIEGLGKADLEKMNSAADRLFRADSRAIVKLFMIQGLLKEDKKPDGTPSAGSIIYYN